MPYDCSCLLQPVPNTTKHNADRQHPSFIVHLRVMFFVPNVTQLTDPETRNLHYTQVREHDLLTHLKLVMSCAYIYNLQLKQDIVSDRLCCSTTTTALTLATLAFQVEHGAQTGTNQPYSYAQAKRYMCQRMRKDLEGLNLDARLSELHSEYKELSEEHAQGKFFQEVYIYFPFLQSASKFIIYLQTLICATDIYRLVRICSDMGNCSIKHQQ